MPFTIQIGDSEATIGLPDREEPWSSNDAALAADLNSYSRFSLYGNGYAPDRDLAEADEVVAEARRSGKRARIVHTDASVEEYDTSVAY